MISVPSSPNYKWLLTLCSFSFHAQAFVQSRKAAVTYDALTTIIANGLWKEHNGLNSVLLTCSVSQLPLTASEVCTAAVLWLSNALLLLLPSASFFTLLCGICIHPFVNSSQMYFKYSRILYNLSGIHNKDALIPESFNGIQRTCFWDARFTFPFKESVI